MVKYNEKTNAFESKYKTFSLCDVTEAQVFMWVKTGELSFGDFLVWYDACTKGAYMFGIKATISG